MLDTIAPAVWSLTTGQLGALRFASVHRASSRASTISATRHSNSVPFSCRSYLPSDPAAAVVQGCGYALGVACPFLLQTISARRSHQTRVGLGVQARARIAARLPPPSLQCGARSGCRGVAARPAHRGAAHRRGRGAADGGLLQGRFGQRARHKRREQRSGGECVQCVRAQTPCFVDAHPAASKTPAGAVPGQPFSRIVSVFLFERCGGYLIPFVASRTFSPVPDGLVGRAADSHS